MIDATRKKIFNLSSQLSTLDLKFQVTMCMRNFSPTFGAAWCTQVVFQFFIQLLSFSMSSSTGFIRSCCSSTIKEQVDSMNNWRWNPWCISSMAFYSICSWVLLCIRIVESFLLHKRQWSRMSLCILKRWAQSSYMRGSILLILSFILLLFRCLFCYSYSSLSSWKSFSSICSNFYLASAAEKKTLTQISKTNQEITSVKTFSGSWKYRISQNYINEVSEIWMNTRKL